MPKIVHSFILMSIAGGALLATGCKGDKPTATPPAPVPARSAASPATTPPPAPPPPISPPTPEAAPADPAASPVPTLPPTPRADVADVGAYTVHPLNSIELPSGLVIEDLKLGSGAAAFPKAFITFHYRAKMKDGAEFDATIDHDGSAPLTESLGSLFPGLSNGLVGIKPGGRRRLTVPPAMAAGIVGMRDEKGDVVIPPDATLIYVVDMLDIKQQLIAAPPAGVKTPSAPESR